MKPAAVGATLLLATCAASSAQQRQNPFGNAKTWAFQLKNLETPQQAKIAASPFDLVVIDSEQYINGVETPLKREEVDAERPHVCRPMRNTLGSIDADQSTNIYCVGFVACFYVHVTIVPRR